MSLNRPIVLSFSGHDPSGGAGVQADIETLVSHRCHAASVITALTEQDTRNVKKLIPQQPEAIIAQAGTLLDDLPVKTFKIGLIGHHETAAAIREVLSKHPDIPVVLDPVLAAGGGAELSNTRLIDAIVDLLLPCTTVLTPNSEEARKLARLTDLNDCGLALLDKGCDYVLITGTHEDTPSVGNRLYHDGRCWETYTWDRLPFSYHGSGCTLAATIAALLAHGLEPLQAVAEAQEYTWNSLHDAYQAGKGQHIPNRLFWMDET
ncbi:MAG: bifunctional hydroxymethylpyrimidine kinase/phosphomethylpyrimidine kinase [Methylobacter sp.]